MAITTIQLLVATTSGNTEYLADQLAAQLQESGYTAQVHYEPDYSELVEGITDETLWIGCIASHGAGDYADSMLAFADDLHAKKPRLEALKYAVIAVGDSCYDTYCAAGRDFDERLANAGAKRLTERLEIDMSQDDPEEKALTWLASLQTQL